MVKKDKAFIITAVLEILAIIFVSLGIWIAYTNFNIDVSYYEVKDDLIPDEFDGFKIAQVSDLHDRDWRGELESLVAAEKPDIIVVTGDIINSVNEYYDNSLDFLKQAVKIAPVYFISGNHEADCYNYRFIKNLMSEIGVIIADDKSFIIERGDKSINLIGIEDPSFTEKNDYFDSYHSIIKEKINTLKKEGLYNIVLSHRPEYFRAYVEAGADLVLCGHAHGGQLIIGDKGLFAPGQGFFPEYTQGIHIKNDTSMIVSRGLGDSVLPRVNNMPELVIVTLRFK